MCGDLVAVSVTPLITRVNLADNVSLLGFPSFLTFPCASFPKLCTYKEGQPAQTEEEPSVKGTQVASVPGQNLQTSSHETKGHMQQNPSLKFKTGRL